jgi:hypothetical protein
MTLNVVTNANPKLFFCLCCPQTTKVTPSLKMTSQALLFHILALSPSCSQDYSGHVTYQRFIGFNSAIQDSQHSAHRMRKVVGKEDCTTQTEAKSNSTNWYANHFHGRRWSDCGSGQHFINVNNSAVYP